MICAAARPLHERIRPLGVLRQGLRRHFFSFLRKLADTDDARSIQASSLQNLLAPRPEARDIGPFDFSSQPYSDVGCLPNDTLSCQRTDIIIISARFRSGSTLLWNLFRAISGCTAYYEPFNERRWFDASSRGNLTDPTHRGVSDYWREYEGLDDLGQHYREDWIRHGLFMDAHSWDPAMKRYVEILVERASGRPVLQFNRIDFRLAWFRHHFPGARLVHLYRHPRDQWMSSLVDPARFTKDGTTSDFAPHDHYYLRMWASDLKYHFPFLEERFVSHPYQMFYYLWKLSYLFGKRHAHVSLAYEDLLKSPENQLLKLLDILEIRGADLSSLTSLIDKPRSGRWKEYAGEDWFRRLETHCESVLADFFSK
jgi:hypothetical protein